MALPNETVADTTVDAHPAPGVAFGWKDEPTVAGRCLVALDIDGTIVTHGGELSHEVAAAIDAVRQRGHEIVLATGRSVAGTLPVAAQLGLNAGWLVCSNGAVTVELDTSAPTGYRVVDTVTFDPEPVLRSAMRESPDILIAVEDVGLGSFVSRPFPDGELGGDQVVVSIDELCARPATRVVLRSPDHDAQHFVELAQRLGLDEVSYYVGWTAWMDIVAPGVHKASALQKLVETRRLVFEHSVAVGDGFNDVEMLQWADFSVAMGHGAPAVQAAAAWVTAPVGEDGLAQFLTWLAG